MKLIILSIGIAASSFASCKDEAKKTSETQDKDTTSTEISSPVVQKDSASLTTVLAEYIKLKNALVASKPADAGVAANALVAALDKVDSGLMTESQRKAYTDNHVGAKEHAQQIASDNGNLKSQREHFSKLSRSIYDMVKGFGTTETLYKDYCPMKKAIWLSETKPVRNPYYGNEMLTCGEVQETIKQ
jgi:hypothetical protein